MAYPPKASYPFCSLLCLNSLHFIHSWGCQTPPQS